jgi:P27 family predicted phage terminase small subunit
MTIGRPPTPTAKLQLRGSFRKDRHGDRADVEVESAKLECPAWASESARAHWPEISEVLAGMQVSTVADRGAMVLLVDALAQYQHARQVVETEGITTTGSMGNAVVHPAVRVRDAAWARALKAMSQFGLTPSSRASVKTASKKEKPSGKSRFFNPTG